MFDIVTKSLLYVQARDTPLVVPGIVIRIWKVNYVFNDNSNKDDKHDSSNKDDNKMQRQQEQ